MATKTSKTYTFHQDAGHGWLAVPLEECIKLGILKDITSYSYFKGCTIYLEEDCDMQLFFESYNGKFGEEPKLKQAKYKERSQVRSYMRFTSKVKEYCRNNLSKI